MKSTESKFYVFELYLDKLRCISFGFDTCKDADSFVKTMKESYHYNSSCDYKLFVKELSPLSKLNLD